VVRGAEKFFSKLRTAGKKRLLPFLSRKPSNLVVLLFETDLKKGETAKEPLKTLFATAEAVLKAPKPDKRQIAKLVANRFKAEGVVVEPAVVEYLTEQFADDLTALRTELEKLTTYATDTKRLTLSEVKELTFGNPKVSVFDFQDAFFGKNLKEALDTFRGLTANLTSYEKSAVVFQLLGLLLSTANRLLILKERAPSEGEDKVLRSLGVVYKFQAQKFKNWANLWSEKELKDLVRQLYLTDRALKVKFENPEESLKRLVVNAVGG
jgi:DNA polymerase-3 subunit delta